MLEVVVVGVEMPAMEVTVVVTVAVAVAVVVVVWLPWGQRTTGPLPLVVAVALVAVEDAEAVDVERSSRRPARSATTRPAGVPPGLGPDAAGVVAGAGRFPAPPWWASRRPRARAAWSAAPGAPAPAPEGRRPRARRPPALRPSPLNRERHRSR